MEILKGLVLAAAMVGWIYWMNRRKWLLEEFERNEVHEAPSDHQLRWDIRHLREDIGILTISNSTIMLLLAALLLFR